jgi:hypothetical protein
MLMEEQENPTRERDETPEEWAHRVTGKLRGLLKEEMAAFGGGEAFLRWVRSGDEGAPPSAKPSNETGEP